METRFNEVFLSLGLFCHSKYDILTMIYIRRSRKSLNRLVVPLLPSE